MRVTKQDNTRRYLLGQMPESDRARLEEQLLSDETFYEEVLIAEDELVDEYLAGGLSTDERERFENYFLRAPERLQKLRFSRALRRYATADAAGQVEPLTSLRAKRFLWFPKLTPTLGFALTAVVVVAIFGIVWLAIRKPAGRPIARTLAITLTPGTTRDESAQFKKIMIPGDVSVVRLQLEIPRDEYSSYEIVIADRNGKIIDRKKSLHAQPAAATSIVGVDLPVTSLAPNDYLLKLNGQTAQGASESVASYFFRVLPR